MKTVASQPEFDFEHELPPGREFFQVRELAALWRCSLNHVKNLIDSGEIKIAVDLRGSNASRAMQRIPRAAVVKFLNHRKTL